MTVTQMFSRTTPQVTRPAWRLHQSMPTDPVQFTEWCIETQLAAACEMDDPQAYAVLFMTNQLLDQVVTASVECLLALAGEIADAERDGKWPLHKVLVDDYTDELRLLATTLRGGA